MAKEVLIRSKLGAYPVSITHHELRTSRPDPLNNQQARRLMLSLFRPQASHAPLSQASWMPETTADVYNAKYPTSDVPSLTFRRIKLEQASDSSQPLALLDAPLLLFSPGAGCTRFSYSAMLSAIASSGYTIISVDHTFEAEIVEFPNGDILRRNINAGSDGWNKEQVTTHSTKTLLPVRTADLQSVLTAADAGTIPGLESTSGRGVGVFGHCLGGDTAAATIQENSRFVGALLFDAPLRAPPKRGLIHRPFLMVYQSRFPHTAPLRSFWRDVWALTDGWKALFRMPGTVHLSFSDYPLALSAAGVDLSKDSVRREFGWLRPQRIQNFTWRLTVLFFDLVMKGRIENSAFLKIAQARLNAWFSRSRIR